MLGKKDTFDRPDASDVPDESGAVRPPRPVRLCRQVCRDARRCLTSRWGKACAGMLFINGLVLLFWLLRDFFAAAGGFPAHAIWLEGGILELDAGRLLLDLGMFAVMILLISPPMLGYCRFIYRLTSGEESSLAVIFSPMRSMRMILRSFSAVVVLCFLFFAATTIFCLPGALSIAAAFLLGGNVGWAAGCRIGLLLLGGLLTVLGLFFSAAVLTRFAAVPYILADEEHGLAAAFSLSLRATKGFSGELFLMWLYFLPMLLLCIFWVPVFFVLPYMMASFGLFTRILLDRLSERKAD